MCSCYTCPSQTISTTNNVRAIGGQDYHRTKPLPPHKANWEMGLREATVQALVREQVSDPALRTGIYAASIEGLQDTATPFGDIALIARGQLFATAHGYHFVQDAYHNDCGDCNKHSTRCGRRQCQDRNEQQHWTEDARLDNLMALWTVKRIRHRDPKLGHRYELQFTISPMGPAANPHFVARNGRFDYNVPGHVFIVKLRDSTDATQSFRFDKEHRSSNHNEFKVLPWSHNIDQLYQQHHHHGTPITPQTPNSITFNTDLFAPPPQKERRPAAAAATTEHQKHVYNPGFLIGISPNGYKHILHDLPGFVGERPPYLPPPRHYIPPPLAPPSTPKEPIKHLHHHFYIPEVEDIDYDAKKTQRPAPPTPKHQPPATTFIYTAGTTQHQVPPPITHPYTDFQTTITQPPTLYKFYTVAESSPTAPPAPFNPSPFYIQYSEPDPMYSHSPVPTIPTFITTHSVQPTVSTLVTLSDLEEQHPKTATLVSLFDEIAYTVAAQTSTASPLHTLPAAIKHKKQKYPDSINAQLPPPDKNTDTTVPYVASTAVTFVSTTSSSPRFDYTTEDSSEERGETSEERKATTIQEQHITHIEKFNGRKKTTPPMIEVVTIAPTITTTETATITNSAGSTIEDFSSTTMVAEEKKTAGDAEIFATISIPQENKKKTTIAKDEQLDVELFGSTKRTTVGTRATAQPGTKNAFDEIFSEYRPSTEQTKRLLTPHTQLSINNTDALRNARISKYLKYKKNRAATPHRDRFSLKAEKEKRQKEAAESTQEPAEGEPEAKTSQSFITSISFKVNKAQQGNGNETAEFHIHEIQKPNTSTDRAQTFDDVAQTLVNHARIEAYLNAKRRRAAHHKPDSK